MKIIKVFLFSIILAIAAGAAQEVLCAADASSTADRAGSAAAKSYNLKLNYSNGQLLVKGITVENFSAPDRRVQPQNGWICDIVSADGKTINSFKFSIPAITCNDQSGAAGNLEGGCQTAAAAADFTLSVPYYPAAAAIAVYSPEGVEAFSADTVKFADLCGDNVCEAGENRLTCAEDCRSGVKDGVCDGTGDGTCDPDCSAKTDNDCKSGLQNAGVYLLVAALLALAALAGLVFWQAKKKRF